MLVPDFIKWAESMQVEENRIMLTKGEEYTVSDEDKFKNFKSIGDRTNTTPELVNLILLLKHIDSIRNFVIYGTQPSDEPIMGRVHDARNYLLLLGGLIHEAQMKNEERLMEEIDEAVETFDGEILR